MSKHGVEAAQHNARRRRAAEAPAMRAQRSATRCDQCVWPRAAGATINDHTRGNQYHVQMDDEIAYFHHGWQHERCTCLGSVGTDAEVDFARRRAATERHIEAENRIRR